MQSTNFLTENLAFLPVHVTCRCARPSIEPKSCTLHNSEACGLGYPQYNVMCGGTACKARDALDRSAGVLERALEHLLLGCK